MDNLTHTLLGGALASAGLGRRTPRATATLLVGANLPDVDAVSYFLSPDLALAWRRGWTHGVLALALLPPLLTAAVVLWDRAAARSRRRRGQEAAAARPARLLVLAYLAVASHPLLDWLNTYGIRLLAPFDWRWFYGDTLFIVDPWLWLLLGGALFLGTSRSRRGLGLWGGLALLTTLIVIAGAPAAGAQALWLAGVLGLAVLRLRAGSPDRRRAARLARGALALAGLYVALLAAGSALAERQIRGELAARGIGPLEDLMVGPVATAPLRCDVVAVTASGYRFATWDWLARPRFRLAGERPRPEPTPVVAAALAAPSICGMAGWLRFPMVEIEERDDGFEVYVLDARYSRGRRRGFGTGRVRLGRDLTPVP